MKISIVIPTFNRPDMCLESFKQVIDDNRVNDIRIIDDASEPENYNRLYDGCLDLPKTHIYRNAVNIGMAANKRKAVSYASCSKAIILDDDNIIDTSYLDALHKNAFLEDDTIINCPSFAAPHFDFTEHSWEIINKDNVKGFIQTRSGEILLNACNYLVPRNKYLEVYEDNPDIGQTDTLWFNLLWLRAGYSFYIVPGLKYFHRVHDDSGFNKNLGKNMDMAAKIKSQIMEL